MDTLPAAQAKRTAWENDRPNWNPTDEEFMALEKSIDLRIKRCQQLDQQCQKAFLRVKEYESSQERELLIDTEQILKPFAKFWEFLASYVRPSTSKTKLA
ncbi:hypothetical protein Ae201684_016633 [Aphanomyces euteiches]|uniref:Uncharacterized protein n=1 Tax=Aphanomyces euteiches TaxID=100861 RepID=A0A6G0WBV4_9STRA|nr:hypothetical protein Ae201684_016633 [Aphanomyces euteiches]KAH9150077.1 hypothetical protein AeRB84_007022 [Aphanomyces euteiches]